MNPNQLIPTTLLTEIIIQILLKLLFESLLRYKSVCKEWYSLISDQNFIKTHYTISSTNINYEHHRLIYNIYEQKNDLYNCPLYDVLFDESANNALLLENPLRRTWLHRVRIVGSCNGLVCLSVDDNTLFIYNPSTRTINNILPWCKEGASWLGIFYGFGYDETTHDYKVVKIWRSDLTWPSWNTMLYSLKTQSWKDISHFPCHGPFTHGKFLNGALHWVDRGSSRDIVSLDLGKETYGEFLQPEYTKGSKKLTLGVLGEWLCVLCNYYESRVVDVWVMKVYGVKDSWTKLLSITHPNDRNSIPSYMDVHAPLSILNDGKLLLQFRTKLVVCDCINGSCSEIQNFNGFCNVCIVVESLISPFAPLSIGDNNGNEN